MRKGKRARRGQVEAPIELFVAVIILVMSMALALTVWNGMQEQECVAKIKTVMSRVQNAMVSIAISSPPSTRIETITFPRCGKYDVKAVQLAYFSKPEYCRLCPGHYGGCWQLIPLSHGADGKYSTLTDAITCVQISGQIDLRWDDNPSSCSTSEQRLKDCPCPEGNLPSCSECSQLIHFVENQDFAKYHSLGRPQEGNSLILRLTSSSAIAPEKSKEILVCAMKPSEFNG
jgi:hypothetical protein